MKVYQPGQKLRDTNYGTGVVLAADPEYTTIRFRGHGVKKFITAMLQMEAIGEPKPPAARAPAAAPAPDQGAKKPPQKAARPKAARSPKRAVSKARRARRPRHR